MVHILLHNIQIDLHKFYKYIFLLRQFLSCQENFILKWNGIKIRQAVGRRNAAVSTEDVRNKILFIY